MTGAQKRGGPTRLRRRRVPQVPLRRLPRWPFWRVHRSSGLLQSASDRASNATAAARRAGLRAARSSWKRRVDRAAVAWPHRRTSRHQRHAQMLPSQPGGPRLFPFGIDDITTRRVPQVSGNEKCTGCSASLVRCRSMSLKAQLDACRREYEAKVEPQVVDAARRSIQALSKTGLVAKAVKAGETAPLFRLRCRRGGFIALSDLLECGPVVISFFWGDWCPFCLLELNALAAARPEIERLGATLVALSPQARAEPPLPGSDGEPSFPILRDPGCEIAARYRIAFTIPQQFRSAYLALGYANSTKTGSNGWVVPMPATYVHDRTGLIVLSYLDADHSARLEPAEIIVALSHLRRGHSQWE